MNTAAWPSPVIVVVRSVLPRSTVDWDTSQADDFRREVGDGRSNEPSWRTAGRRGAATRAWCNSTRARGQDVTPAQECGGAAAAARGRPGDRLARTRRHGSNAERLAGCLPGRG